jgi:hypothetical protein
LLSPSPSAKSRFTPVSTSNPLAAYKGQAIRPVPTQGVCPGPQGLTQGATPRKSGPILRYAPAITAAGPDRPYSKFHSFGASSLTRAPAAGGVGVAC